MSSTKTPWFVPERSEALASWLLTSRHDVRIRNKQERDDGVDLLVEINTGEALSTRLFVVQVRGTMSSDANDRMQTVGHLFSGGSVYLPAVVVVVNVRDNRSVYSWLAEPNSATLQFREYGEFHTFDAEAVNEIADRVKAWYDALPKQPVSA